MSAKKVIMSLLSAHRGESMSVRELIEAAELLSVAESNVRVTLARLKQEGLVEATSRGHYRLGEAAQPIQAVISHWRDAERRVVAWAGAWVGVYTANLSRADRARAKQRERALRMMGMRELEPGLFLRPDNLRGGVEDLARRLRGLGLEHEAPVFAIAWFDPHAERRARSLWDGPALKAQYLEHVERLASSASAIEAMTLGQAARQAYEAGDAAIRQIVLDPFLPEPLVDVQARAQLIEAMRAYDELGRALWQAVFQGRARQEPVAQLPGWQAQRAALGALGPRRSG